jgi:Transcriptional regulator, AbiEi antitoxin, Type IV TA system/Transcriptional regulator, AbiEi antitoxin N-terminal domain
MQRNMNLRKVHVCAIKHNMAKQKRNHANWLEHHLPEGLLVDSAWLTSQGYSTSLRTQYVTAGRLIQPARRVYQRPRGVLAWQQVVISLQTLLARDLIVGGRTALELHGLAHYLTQSTTTVFLHGPKSPPTWLASLPAGAAFQYRKDARLFRNFHVTTAPHSLDATPAGRNQRTDGIVAQPWGQWNWPLLISSPERAILEFLDELPENESFHQADMLMEGLSTLSPNRMQALLADCHNIKVNRLFLFFADRHKHAWLKRIDRKVIDLGRGKRALAKGGRYDPKYMITVPGDLDGVH